MTREPSVVECYDLPQYLDPEAVYALLPKTHTGYWERVDRNLGWITRDEQELLRAMVIPVAGCGGMGAQLAEKFVRLGVGEIRISDIENFDSSNINRQLAATRNTIGKSKAFETARVLRNIADDSTLVVYPQGIVPETADAFVAGADVVCDEIEFWAIGARILLHIAARKAGIGVLNCNTVGFGTRLFLFTPKSKTIESTLGYTLHEALELEARFRAKTVRRDETKRLMEAILAGLVPELPNYTVPESAFGNSGMVRRRLLDEEAAPIIATNPPLATGFLADWTLLHLLRNSHDRPHIADLPETPGYLYFDAAQMMAKVVRPEERE